MSKVDFNSRRLDVLYLHIAAEWNYEKNNGLSPSDVTYGSNRRVWWHCRNGHEWESTVHNRTRGRDCPYCSRQGNARVENSLSFLYPEIAAQWLQEKNGAITPEDVKPSSEIKVWWRCENGHEWKAAVYARARSGNGCPYCAGKRVLKGSIRFSG